MEEVDEVLWQSAEINHILKIHPEPKGETHRPLRNLRMYHFYIVSPCRDMQKEPCLRKVHHWPKGPPLWFWTKFSNVSQICRISVCAGASERRSTGLRSLECSAAQRRSARDLSDTCAPTLQLIWKISEKSRRSAFPMKTRIELQLGTPLRGKNNQKYAKCG